MFSYEVEINNEDKHCIKKKREEFNELELWSVPGKALFFSVFFFFNILLIAGK